MRYLIFALQAQGLWANGHASKYDDEHFRSFLENFFNIKNFQELFPLLMTPGPRERPL